MQNESLVPEIRFPEFDENWFKKSLAELMTFKNGLNASKEDYGFGYKFINVLDIIENDFITYDVIIGSVNASEEEFKKNIVEYGDILFQRSSETREEVGQANVYLDKEQPATFGGFVIRGKKIADYNPIFMNFLLKTSRSRKEITSKSGGSTRYNVGQGTLSEVTIFTTKDEEQLKIASFLTAIDKRIKLLEEKKIKLEEYKKGVIQQLFNQDIRFKDENGKNFHDWEVKKLGEVCELKHGYQFRRTDFEQEGLAIIKISNVIGSELSINDLSFIDENRFKEFEKFEINNGDILMSLTGNIGRVLEVKNKPFPLIQNYRVGKFIPNNENELSKKFLKFLLASDLVFGRFNQLSNQSAQANFGKQDMDKIKIKLPCLVEQNKIALFLISLEDSLNTIQKSIDIGTKFKKGLLQKLFV